MSEESHESFNPGRCLLGLLMNAREQHSPCRIRHALLGEVLIDPRQQRYITVKADLEGLSKVPANRLQVTPLNQGGLGSSGRPLEELFWCVAWHASAGRLPLECNRHDVIELQRWPNLSRLPATPEIMRLCALLSRKAHSLHLARKLLEVSEEDAYRFYAAGWYSGLIRQISRSTQEQDDVAAMPQKAGDEGSSTGKLGQTLRALWKRLKGA